MITGLTGYKGRIHVYIGNVILTEFDDIIHHDTPKEQFSSLAATIDEQIQGNIKLWPTNYIAYDMLMKMDTLKEKYSEQEKLKFIKYIESKLEKNQLFDEDSRIRLLSIYANPVKNKIRLTQF